MKKQLLSAFMILLVGFGSLLQLSAFVHSNRDYLPQSFIALVPPPPEALAVAYGVPLNTANIGLFAYYKHSSWDLSDCVPAFRNYTQSTNYIDGYVRVWSDERGTNFEGDMAHDPSTNYKYAYIDVQVRVRSDGWILAWITEDQNKAFICHWGYKIRNTLEAGLPDNYATCLSRAIYRVYHNAGVSWIGYDVVKYYDYQYSDSTRLSIFGLLNFDGAGASPSDEHFYFIVPSVNAEIEACWIAAAGYSDVGTDGIYLDASKKIAGTTGFGWYAVDVSGSVNEDIRHDVRVYHDASSGSGIGCSVILWTS